VWKDAFRAQHTALSQNVSGSANQTQENPQTEQRFSITIFELRAPISFFRTIFEKPSTNVRVVKRDDKARTVFRMNEGEVRRIQGCGNPEGKSPFAET
jgi:hypothetical protein